MSEAGFPARWGLVPDRETRLRNDSQIVMGGAPFRVLRMTSVGAALTKRWFAGEPVGSSSGERALARRVVSAGLAHPQPPPAAQDGKPHPIAMTVVIPVKDDAEGLSATLGALTHTDSASDLGVRIIVVDDGSGDPIAQPDHGRVTVVRNDVALGPGAARNVGLALVSTEIVAFVDAGVRISIASLQLLANHLTDPEVCAAAPRVRSIIPSVATSLERYERHNSPLDLGANPCAVTPGSVVSYVPTACLLVRTGALVALGVAGATSSESFAGAGGPFDPALRYGEDVDLLWRLGQTGTIRYVPDIEAEHPPRETVRQFVTQRINYGSSAAPLAKRHGKAVAPFRASLPSAGVLTLLFTGRWFAGVGALAAMAHRVAGKLGAATPDREVEGVRLALVGNFSIARSLGDTSLRAWAPAFAIAALLPGVRSASRAVLVTGLVSNAWEQRSASGMKNKAIQSSLGLLDGFSYGLGVWKGSISQRSVAALVPDLGLGD